MKICTQDNLLEFLLFVDTFTGFTSKKAHVFLTLTYEQVKQTIKF